MARNYPRLYRCYTKAKWTLINLHLPSQLVNEESNLQHSRNMNTNQLSCLVGSFASSSPAAPAHWDDRVHENDGGADLYGKRPQNGTELIENSLQTLANTGGYATSWDDVSGAELDPDLVKAARKTEIAYFRKMNAYTRVKRSEALKSGCPIISLRWRCAVCLGRRAPARRVQKSHRGREMSVGRF